VSGYGGFMPHYPPLPLTEQAVASGHTKDIEILKRRPSKASGMFYARWTGELSPAGGTPGTFTDDFECELDDTNHPDLFPGVGGSFGSTAHPLIDYYWTGNTGFANLRGIWFFRVEYDDVWPLDGTCHAFGSQMHNEGGGSSTGFASSTYQLPDYQDGSPVTFNYSGRNHATWLVHDRAAFGNNPSDDAVCSNRCWYQHDDNGNPGASGDPLTFINWIEVEALYWPQDVSRY
jgi:hypothetical protein